MPQGLKSEVQAQRKGRALPSADDRELRTRVPRQRRSSLSLTSSEQRAQGSWGGVSNSYLKVSLMAARSRGSSEVALWGFSEMLASAARVSWRKASCTSGFRASSKSVISKEKPICRNHRGKAQAMALAMPPVPGHPSGIPSPRGEGHAQSSTGPWYPRSQHANIPLSPCPGS